MFRVKARAVSVAKRDSNLKRSRLSVFFIHWLSVYTAFNIYSVFQYLKVKSKEMNIHNFRKVLYIKGFQSTSTTTRGATPQLHACLHATVSCSLCFFTEAWRRVSSLLTIQSPSLETSVALSDKRDKLKCALNMVAMRARSRVWHLGARIFNCNLVYLTFQVFCYVC